MPYKFTCPLCLEKLGESHFLRVFKIAEAGTKKRNPKDRINCGKEDFIEDILRFGGQDVFVPVDDHATYVSHEKCKGINPFWTKAEKKLDIPGDDSEGETFTATLQCIVTNKGFRQNLSYWMVKILRETVKFGNDYQPMWYPLQLLLATASEEGQGQKRPFGSLVEMASTKSVGKTILTLQILNQALYRNGREVSIRDFFYPHATLEDVDLTNFRDKFYSEVFYHSMWSETPFSRPWGTLPSPGDLRAVFIQPVSSGNPQTQSEENKANGRFLRTLSKFVQPMKAFMRAVVFTESPGKENERKSGPKLDDLFQQNRDKYWSPIIFYDTAGELQQKRGSVTRAVRQLTNKLAICIDAREIFNQYEPQMPEETVTPVGERTASIRHAYRRLSDSELMSPERRRAVCLVVTKLDVVLTAEEKEQVKAIAEDSGADEAARKLLSDWLRRYSNHDKENLRSLLKKEEPRLVDRVFFVWTENLPRMKGVRRSPIKSIEPTSARPGAEVFLEAEPDFDFEEATKVTFNGKKSDFKPLSKQRIRATVPEGATSGLIGILLEEKPPMGQTSHAVKVDDATSNIPFTVLPNLNSDASKPRTYGLIKFLAWCLDKRVEEISQPTND
ncbi:MAG TPA: hypothetical protein VLB46_13710 [Pyrinomonadaceae bacterium]|nr:hypothetical protein [Pyrinomonadaceae bacterium]